MGRPDEPGDDEREGCWSDFDTVEKDLQLDTISMYLIIRHIERSLNHMHKHHFFGDRMRRSRHGWGGRMGHQGEGHEGRRGRFGRFFGHGDLRFVILAMLEERSEERRVGKECCR